MLLLKHTIEYLTNNGELDTSDGQRLLTTSLKKLAKSNLSDLKDCDCRKDWEIRILFGKQNTVEEFEFECSRCGQRFSLKSVTSVVKATTRPRSAIYNVIVAHSFLLHFKRIRKNIFFSRNLSILFVKKQKTKNYTQKSGHFSGSDHVTWGVVRWHHKLNHTCPQWMLSKFGPMKAYMCWVTANSFFPSNGLKRYCNGPLKHQYM